ncbi:MAG: sulfatase [Gemmataceae bacterium]
MYLSVFLGIHLSITPAAAQPNFVLVLADDLRYDALGCAGNPVVKTPHIDRLAANGVAFRNSFVTTSICGVSRASILTGQYARRHGIGDLATPLTLERWAETYPAILREAGYRTGFIGKFGVGKDVSPMAAEFDYWRGLPGQAGLFFDPKDATKTHATAKFGNHALEFLDGCEPGKPFCLSVSFSAPHARDGQPREFPPDVRDESLYADATIVPPPTAAESFYQALPEFARDLEGRRRWARRFSTPEMYQSTVRDYYRLITGIDREVGRIVEKLREHGVLDNTLIIFTSDNGFMLGDRGMADKWLMYEESIRVPLIVVDPRQPSRHGSKVDAMVLNIDLAPTLLDAAGMATPAGMQGRSLLPLIRGEAPAWRGEWFYEHHTQPKLIPPSEGVRTERWKYLRWVGVEPAVEELYDLSADPLEATNLAPHPEHAAKLAELRARWQALGRELR